MNIYRQGDVLLKKATRKPRGKLKAVARTEGRIVLALGEATGHAHVVLDEGDAVLSRDSSDRLWLEILGPATLRHGDLKTLRDAGKPPRANGPDFLPPLHDATRHPHTSQPVPASRWGDHADIALEKGVYEVVRQREYAPDDDRRARNVQD